MKIRTVGAELFHADGRPTDRYSLTDRRTDMTKLIVVLAILRMLVKRDIILIQSF
jgi:hypothetical protein